MDRIRLVTLDMVGTVIKFSQPPVAQYQRVAANHGYDIEFNPLANSFKHQWMKMNKTYPHFGSTTAGLSSIVWWHNLVKNTFKDVLGPDYDDKKISLAASELYSLYHSPRPYLTLEDGLQALDILRSRGITVGAISNFDNRLHDIVPSLGLNKYLQFVVTSEDAKSSKPEELIFEFALNKSGLKNLKPDEILHIGDDLDNDYWGARAMCWNSLLLDRWGGGYTTIPEEHVIENIMEVFNKTSLE